ncbi:MAG TPA: hypothetical protein DCY80_01520 [Solibacterales bacterium]|nr:hypothetical protein [Bryobacterales bacterium]
MDVHSCYRRLTEIDIAELARDILAGRITEDPPAQILIPRPLTLTSALLSASHVSHTFASICTSGHFSVKSHPRPNFALNQPG